MDLAKTRALELGLKERAIAVDREELRERVLGRPFGQRGKGRHVTPLERDTRWVVVASDGCDMRERDGQLGALEVTETGHQRLREPLAPVGERASERPREHRLQREVACEHRAGA